MNNYILTDEELNELAEYALCTQGGLLSDFLNEVKVAAQATKNEGAALRNEKARILFLMRAVYFLGIQRGGEAYRLELQVQYDLEESERMAFALSESCLSTALWDLECLSEKELKKLWGLLGLNVK